MDAIKQVYDKVKSEYGKNITNKLKMVDALAVYALVTAMVQVKKPSSYCLIIQPSQLTISRLSFYAYYS